MAGLGVASPARRRVVRHRPQRPLPGPVGNPPGLDGGRSILTASRARLRGNPPGAYPAVALPGKAPRPTPGTLPASPAGDSTPSQRFCRRRHSGDRCSLGSVAPCDGGFYHSSAACKFPPPVRPTGANPDGTDSGAGMLTFDVAYINVSDADLILV